MESCDSCPYARYPKIPASKIQQAEVAIVGEAPGAQEIARRRPFIGPSGQLLDKVLQTTQLPERSNIFVTNALLCRPPQKKPKLKSAIRCCQSRLMEEMEQVKPKLIIALGNIAMHALTDDHDLRITKEQGRVIKSKFLPDVNIVPVVHPAAILRSPGEYKLFYGAMHSASNIYSGQPASSTGTTTWREVQTSEDMEALIALLRGRDIIAADIETTGLNPRRDDVLVLGIAYERNKVIVVWPEFLTKELFEIPGLLWSWQNGKFDVSFLRRRGFKATVHHDLMLLSYCLNEHGGIHGLEQIAARELGAAAYKHKVKKKVGKKGFANLPPDDLMERVATDADYTIQATKKLLAKVEANPRLKKLYYNILIPASEFLRQVERNGIYVNRELLAEFKAEYQEHLDDIMDRILDIAQPLWDPNEYLRDTGMKSAPEVFNPGSTYQVAWLLYDKLRIRPRGRKKGRSTDKDMLMKMQGMHPLIDEMLEYRSVTKELSTYIIGVERHIADDGRVHTTFKLHGTVTGRLSSAEPNVQNQPKRKPKVRNIFQAPPGKVLLEADYKGAELRVLAHMSGDKFLTDCFVAGRDLHSEVAKALEISRIRAKAVNFGIPYGRTEYTLAEELGISKEEARSYINDWFNRAPKAKEFLDKCADAPLKGMTLVTPFGRHRRFGLVTPDTLHDLQNEARNFIIQSVASDFTLISGMRAYDALKAMGVKIINLVHDSILMECPDNKFVVRRAARILGDIMKQVPKDTVQAKVPFDVEFKVGKMWGALEEIEEEEVV